MVALSPEQVFFYQKCVKSLKIHSNLGFGSLAIVSVDADLSYEYIDQGGLALF